MSVSLSKNNGVHCVVVNESGSKELSSGDSHEGSGRKTAKAKHTTCQSSHIGQVCLGAEQVPGSIIVLAFEMRAMEGMLEDKTIGLRPQQRLLNHS
jgi:hypothetical protein